MLKLSTCAASGSSRRKRRKTGWTRPKITSQAATCSKLAKGQLSTAGGGSVGKGWARGGADDAKVDMSVQIEGNMSIGSLREKCKRAKLSGKGSREELVDRLFAKWIADDKEDDSAQPLSPTPNKASKPKVGSSFSSSTLLPVQSNVSKPKVNSSFSSSPLLPVSKTRFAAKEGNDTAAATKDVYDTKATAKEAIAGAALLKAVAKIVAKDATAVAAGAAAREEASSKTEPQGQMSKGGVENRVNRVGSFQIALLEVERQGGVHMHRIVDENTQHKRKMALTFDRIVIKKKHLFYQILNDMLRLPHDKAFDNSRLCSGVREVIFPVVCSRLLCVGCVKCVPCVGAW